MTLKEMPPLLCCCKPDSELTHQKLKGQKAQQEGEYLRLYVVLVGRGTGIPTEVNQSHAVPTSHRLQ